MTGAAPALAFVTPVRHPLNSNDYGRVESLLRRSVSSWLGQTEPRIAVVVVANRLADLPDDPRIHQVTVDFPPPSTVAAARTGIPAVLRDKGTKNAIGLARARELGAGHVMFADADDFVSNRIAALTASLPTASGWTVTDGWRVNIDRRTVRPHRGDFHLQCGTSHIVRTDLLPPTSGGVGATQDELYAEQGELLERHLGSHMHLHEDLPLAPLPFPGALYQVGTGESHSGNALGGWGRPVSPRMAGEFGVPRTSMTPTGLARAVLPSSRAVRERMLRALRG